MPFQYEIVAGLHSVFPPDASGSIWMKIQEVYLNCTEMYSRHASLLKQMIQWQTRLILGQNKTINALVMVENTTH